MIHLKSSKIVIVGLLPFLLNGCNLAEKLSNIGESPQLSQIQDPTRLKGYQPITMPMPDALTPPHGRSASLWQTGAQAFFKDQRAGKIGDVLTVIVEMDQKQAFEMTPTINRQNQSTNTVTNALGLENKIANIFPRDQHPGGNSSPNPSWLNVNSQPQLSGTAKYDLTDKINIRLAATIVQILPNGNMVIDGRQEIRLINEVREVAVRGIVRREDISSSNTIPWDKISELRISYGGHGDLSDMQAFPWGQQVMNTILPF